VSIVITTLSPAASGPAPLAVTMPANSPTVKPGAVAETNDSPAGSVSTTAIAPVVGPVPVLVTVISYVPVPPTVNGAAGARLTTWRSGASAITFVGSEARSFVGSTSPAATTVASLTTDGAAAGPTLTSTVNEAESPAASPAGRVATTLPAAKATFQPVPAPLANERPAGSVSLTETKPGSTEPSFHTVITYCPGWPTVKSPAWDFAMRRFGAAVTGVEVLLESLPAPVSPGVVAIAVLPIDGRDVPPRRAVMVTVALSPGASGAA
jgi:hypothetical protein